MANAFRQTNNRFKRSHSAFGNNQNWNNRQGPQHNSNAMEVDAVTIDTLTTEEHSCKGKTPVVSELWGATQQPWGRSLEKQLRSSTKDENYIPTIVHGNYI